MRIGKIEFSPALRTSLIAAVVMCILLSLGAWQVSRGKQKIATQQILERKLALPEQVIESAAFFNENRRFQHARLKGRFDPERQYLLDNRVYKGRPGFIVLTPFWYADGEGVLLVDRGWRPLGESREELPDIAVTGKPVEIHGILSEPYGKLPSFGVSATTAIQKWPMVIRDIEIKQVSAQLGYTMPPYLLHLDGEHGAAYIQDWKPVVEGPDKNYSYAIQWFSMALVLLILYLGLNSRRVDSND